MFYGQIIEVDRHVSSMAYDILFAPFVEVNHHKQLTLLGCGLISNEDTNTFVFLFQTWLKCMNDQAPNGMIKTRQCKMRFKSYFLIWSIGSICGTYWKVAKKRLDFLLIKLRYSLLYTNWFMILNLLTNLKKVG